MGSRPGQEQRATGAPGGAAQLTLHTEQTLAEIDGLRWRYSVGGWVLRDIQLRVQPGERIGLIGRSGSGKSSLALTFNGIIPQSYAGQMGGRVTVTGTDAHTRPVAELAHSVAMVFQSPDDQMSQILVRHEIACGPANLRLPLEEVHQRVAEAIALLHIEHLADRETASLSGGEKQKIALAAALAMRPRLLVLDEPTTDLDPRAKADLISILRDIDPSVAMLIVSHDLETIAPLVQRLVIVDDGAIVVDAPASELLAKPDTLDAHGVAVPQLAALNALLRERYTDWGSPTTVDEIARGIELRELKPEPPPDESAQAVGPPVIELSHVTFRYPHASKPAVEDVSLRVASGEIAAVVGNNGSGKTTLSKLILGLLKPSSGSVTVFGDPVSRIRPDLVGYIYQNPDAMLSQMSVRDEVAFTPRLLGRPDSTEITSQMLSNFGLDELATRFPLALSKGQRQRLAYAAVSASGTPILIFDEPTTGIDLPGCNQIMQYMDSLRRAQKTIVFITHDMPLAMRWADRILVMHDGRLVHAGLPSSLLQLDPEVLAEYRLRLPPIAELARRLGLVGHIATPEDLLERLEAPAAACIS